MSSGTWINPAMRWGATFDVNPPGDWILAALCAQVDVGDIFFPEKAGASAQPAKKICAACEVTAECLNHALANNERFGVWGGMSERERDALKRRKKKTA